MSTKGSNEESLRKDSQPAAEKHREAKEDKAHLEKAKMLSVCAIAFVLPTGEAISPR